MSSLSQTASRKDTASPYQAADGLARALAQAGRKQRVDPEGRLFSSGDAATGIYLIVTGSARATFGGESGRELMCHTAGPGSVLGLTAALCANSYQFDVEALETLEAIFLETDSLNQILRERPELCMQVMTMMCDELSALRQTSDHMRSCGKRNCLLHGSCTHATDLQ